MNKTKLDWALEAVERGLSVFPLTHAKDGKCSCGESDCKKPGKHPLKGSKGFLDAVSTPEDVERIWKARPDANIGAYPGEDVVIVDVDRKNGVDGLASLCERLGVDDWELEGSTFTVSTPTGGLHLYYKAKPDEKYASAVGTLPGIDIRAIGGYVLAPGSEIDGKFYEISADTPMQDVRTDLQPILTAPRSKQDNTQDSMFELDTGPAVSRALSLLDRREPATEGAGGNEHTYATVCLVKDLGISADKCLELVSAEGGWNERCSPPWDYGELEVLVSNAYRYGKDRPGSKGGIMEAVIGSFQFEDPDAIPDAPETPREDLDSLFFKGMDLTKRPIKREMIVPEWLPAHGFTAVVAARGVGKSVVSLDLAMRVACDMDWHGSKVAENWNVAYLCGEDDMGLSDQMRSWSMLHGRDVPEDRFIASAGIVDLLSAESVQAWTEEILKHANGRKTLIVLDTWQRASSSGSQNDDSDMQKAVHHIEAMARSVGGPAVVPSHPPKNSTGILGSSVIENSTTAIWHLEDVSNGKSLYVERIKGKGKGNHKLFKFEEVKLGTFDLFDIEETGVTPVVLGGSGIAPTTDYNAEARLAYAEVIGRLQLLNSTEEGTGKMGFKDVCEGIQGLTKITNPDDERYTEAHKLIAILNSAGENNLTADLIMNRLRDMFIKNRTPANAGNGMVLVVNGADTNRPKFALAPGGMAAGIPEGAQEDEEQGEETPPW